MRQSTSTSLLLLFIVLNVSHSFAPRPGLGIGKGSTYKASSVSNKHFLRMSTLQETETTTKIETKEIPFHAKQAELSIDDYMHQRSSLQLLDTSSLQVPQEQQKEDENKLAKFAGLGTWIIALSSFLLVNNFVGPWPAGILAAIPVKAFGLTHALSGMFLTTLIEWLATESKNADVLNFYFEKVPKLDALVVLPALSASIVSGVGLAVDHYDSLANSPFHVVGAISTLLAFAIWWAVTDVTTQGKAMEAIQEWTAQADTEKSDIPPIVNTRKISNVVSCLFVAAIYGFMVLKPGL